MTRRRSISAFMYTCVLACVFAIVPTLAGNGVPPSLVPNVDLVVAKNEIKVMSYNVLNLFDTEHDAGMEDWEFLPKSHPLKSKCSEVTSSYYRKLCQTTDWTPELLEAKLSQIGKAIRAQGALPDVLALEEVENDAVVKQLAEYLGYDKMLITHGPDRRGIEVAMLYRTEKLELLHSREVEVTGDESFKEKPTRNILVAHFKILNRSDVLAVYANHWPSQSATADKRVQTAKILMGIVDEDMKNYRNGKSTLHTIALGDFNTIPSDNPHPFKTVLTSEKQNYPFVNVNDHYFEAAHKNDSAKAYEKMPYWTYYYEKGKTYNTLDYIFAGQELMDGKGLEIVPESFRIVAGESNSQVRSEGSDKKLIPKEFNRSIPDPDLAEGVSDHFPVVVKLRWN